MKKQWIITCLITCSLWFAMLIGLICTPNAIMDIKLIVAGVVIGVCVIPAFAYVCYKEETEYED